MRPRVKFDLKQPLIVWRQMPRAQKIALVIAIILTVSYPLLVWIHFAFIRQTF